MIPDFGLERLASRSVAWWAMSEVLPDTHNKVWLNNDQIRINYIHNNREAHDRLVYRWIDTLKAIEADPLTRVVSTAPTHPRGEAPSKRCGLRMRDLSHGHRCSGLGGRCHRQVP
jgi:hypothetical protein